MAPSASDTLVVDAAALSVLVHLCDTAIGAYPATLLLEPNMEDLSAQTDFRAPSAIPAVASRTGLVAVTADIPFPVAFLAAIPVGILALPLLQLARSHPLHLPTSS